MQIVFLGTGGSWPTPLRNVPSVALKMNGEIILFDCGEGTQRQFMLSPLSFMQVRKILISHFHGDHFLGLSGLLFTMALNERKEPVEILGPRGTSQLVQLLSRLGGVAPEFELRVRELMHSSLLEYDGYTIRAVAADHHGADCLGYCVEEKPRPGKFNLEKAKQLGIPAGPLYRKLQAGKTIIYAGREFTPEMVLGPPRRGRKVVYAVDTRPCEAVVELAKDCDVLVHDATLTSEHEQKAREFGHSTAKQAAEIAKRANARTLFLIHLSPRYEYDSALETEARTVFAESYVAKDLMVYEVKYRD